MKRARSRPGLGLAACGLAALAGACRQDMHDQPRHEPLEGASFFADGRASRPEVPGTVARGALALDDHFYRGRVEGELARSFPFEVTREVMARGRERFDIFCAVCHDHAGYGNGTVVERGAQAPESFHTDRLRGEPPGYFYDVITNGFGAMYDYSDRIDPEDRWAIVAWIRALQLSQSALVSELPSDVAARLEALR